ncbi:ComEA family DNA-binding protein [Aquirufa sp. ROCK2-A2]
MRSKIHYYLRFIFGLTQSEIYGFTFLLFLLFVWFVLSQFQAYQFEKELHAHFQPTYYESKLDSIKIKQQNFQKQFASNDHSYTYSNRSRYFVPTNGKKNDLKTSMQRLDINTADSLAWIALPGIGPAFAKRILAYREKLGGFYAVNQLKEVYGLDSVWVNNQIKNLHTGQGIYRKLSLQKTEWKDFRHPYLPYAQAKIFLTYRRQHPEIATFQDLDKIQLIDKTIWNKLKPYLEEAFR